MTRLHCARCGILVATVHDERFGLAPSATLCRTCSSPAYHFSAA